MATAIAISISIYNGRSVFDMVVRAVEEERMLVQGNEAIGWGTLAAGCLHFYGYPITPQNEVIEWFARELPERQGRFVQGESEAAVMNMLVGAAIAGTRVVTSTSSVGFDLMQESISHAAAAQLPCVIVNVQRGGPGGGSTQHSQMDYMQVTRGGGNGGYKNIVLAPSSVQETFDLMQLAFYLADKWRNPTLILTDAIVGQTAEVLERRVLDFGPTPDKEWALQGKAHQKGGLRNVCFCGPMRQKFVLTDMLSSTWLLAVKELGEKWDEMERTEVRYEAYQIDDAEAIVVAFGYVARVAKKAVDTGRAQGLKVGLIRPMTLWPFPYAIIRERSQAGSRLVVAEDNLGQMIWDVRYAVEGRSEVGLVSILDRSNTSPGGMILPGTVLDGLKKALGV